MSLASPWFAADRLDTEVGPDAPTPTRRQQLIVRQGRTHRTLKLMCAMLFFDVVAFAACTSVSGARFLDNLVPETSETIVKAPSVVVSRVGLALVYIAALPASMLLDWLLGPRHLVFLGLFTAGLFAAAMAAILFPARTSIGLAFLTFQLSVGEFILVAISFFLGVAVFMLCLLVADLRGITVRINYILARPFSRALDGERNRRGSLAEALEGGQNQAEVPLLERASSCGASVADVVSGVEGAEALAWFSQGAMSLFVIIAYSARLFSLVFAVFLENTASVFVQFAILALFMVSSALYCFFPIAQIIPPRLSDLPTVEDLIHLDSLSADASGSSTETSSSLLRPTGFAASLSPGFAALRIATRWLFGVSLADLRMAYGEKPVEDVITTYHSMKYIVPFLFFAIARYQLMATSEAAAKDIMRGIGRKFFLHPTEIVHAIVDVASVVAAATGFGVMQRLAASGRSPSVKPLIAVAYGLEALAVVAAFLVSEDIIGRRGEYLWLALLPVGFLMGTADALAWIGILNMQWASVPLALRSMAVAYVFVSWGIGAVCAIPDPVYSGAWSLIAHGMSLLFVLLAVLLHTVYLVADRKRMGAHDATLSPFDESGLTPQPEDLREVAPGSRAAKSLRRGTSSAGPTSYGATSYGATSTDDTTEELGASRKRLAAGLAQRRR